MSRDSALRGFTVLELVVTLAVISILLAIVAQLHLEYMRFDRESTAALFRHPQMSAVTSRVRKDVVSTLSYPASFESWSQGPGILILMTGTNPAVHVVWEFGDREILRREFTAGAPGSVWRAAGTPAFEVSAVALREGGRAATRLRARDDEGRLVFDGVFQPRPE